MTTQHIIILVLSLAALIWVAAIFAVAALSNHPEDRS